uniref:Putative enoyl-coa hydratase/isomerase n=1 Tax=Culex tarsalis TaxID=7177 RepID=A0A1Q3F4X5_CULTA
MSTTGPEGDGIDDGTFIVTLEDGSLTSPKAVGVGSSEQAAIMSDDEGRVITELGKPAASSSGGKVVIHSQTIIRSPSSGSIGNGADRKKEDLLAKMKSRLSKQIDLKMVSSPKAAPREAAQLDTSGSIEIPHDLILSSEIPATPLATAGGSKELEDHDLIAILEGDDVEITENTTEIEVRVGGGDGDDDGVYNDEQVLEEIQISFVDENEINVEQKELEKTIAMRQMAALPVLPKGRRPKKKPEESETEQKALIVAKPKALSPSKPKAVSPPKPVAPKAEPANVTIKGQTTIKPLPRPIIIPKKEPVDRETPRVVTPLSKPKPKVVSGSQALLTPKRMASPPKTPKVSSPSTSDVKQSPNELITALVSDWDDEPVTAPAKPAKVDSKVSMPPPPPPAEDPLALEPPKRSRVIKKKIIWDPDNPETHMSFASFVKTNRSLPKQPTEERAKEAPEPVRPPAPTGIRRKRAESVAVHMIKDPPYTPPAFLKRARTPEPAPKRATAMNAPKTGAGPGNKRGRKSKSELDKLLGDEGAINMLYDLECENSNKDLLKDSDVKLDDPEDEDEKLLAKAKIIADVVKQGTSPNEPVAHVSRVRAKRQTSVSPIPPLAAPTQPSGRKGGPGRKRKTTQNTSRDWDYVYNAQTDNDDAMIIRRRSSSYSSSTSPRRLSVEQTAASHDSSADNFEFVKPTDKQTPKQTDVKLDSLLVANMKGKLSKVLSAKPTATKKDQEESSAEASTSATPPEKKAKVASKPPTVTTTTVRIDENGLGPAGKEESFHSRLAELKLTELTCRLCGSHAEITLCQSDTKLKDVFTVKLLNDLKSVLNLVKSDHSVRAVLIRSINRHFCRGIDVSYLIQPNAEKRKNSAQELSGHLRNFLQTLATFHKPLVAAVHGDILGLGVTILPLFEVVIAQDSSTFSTPYGIFGHLPEAMKLFTSSKNLKPKAITDLLYMSKRVSAATAQDFGLVSEVVPMEKLHEKATTVTKKLASLSPQALRSIKVSLRQDQLARLDEQLTSEQKKLSQQWISAECQEKFKMFCSRGGEW